MEDNLKPEKLSELQVHIESCKQKLALAEQNYESAINTCRTAEAKQFKIQIEYHQHNLQQFKDELIDLKNQTTS
jgi:hypothetical protein